MRRNSFYSILLIMAALGVLLAAKSASAQDHCKRTITADVVALDQPFMWNRLGTAQPNGMVYALERDVVPIDPQQNSCGKPLCAGNVRLREEKRPRPIVLRMNQGDCLQINFTNLLTPPNSNVNPQTGQPGVPSYLPGSLQIPTRNAGIHVMGLDLVDAIGPDGKPQPGIDSDSSWVGANPGTTGSLAAPNQQKNYKYFAREEGVFLLYSAADYSGTQTGAGLFGALNVQPEGAEWYRSQVTEQDLSKSAYHENRLPANMTLTEKVEYKDGRLAQATTPDGRKLWNLTTVNPDSQTVSAATVVKRDGHLYAWALQPYGQSEPPVLNYDALYPADHSEPNRRCAPILKMLDIEYRINGDACQPVAGSLPRLYHSDLTAIITGPNAGRFPYSHTSPAFRENPASPDRRQPYREFTIHYHQPRDQVQPFQEFYNPGTANAFAPGADGFAINYGMAGIAAEILANRSFVGPMGRKDAVEMKFEEFFLSSWAVGDPAMVVDVPANAPNQVVSDPAQNLRVDSTKLANELASPPVFQSLSGMKATRAFYPDDPSNVYHSYMRDHVKFRVLNAGPGPAHVHHLHAHQWLHSPNSDNGHYLDSQMIIPGSAYTLEIVYNGSGNRNQTVGDSIFHCHFYPHFAAGMWSLWRVHDVFEAGTELYAEGENKGKPRPGARALPDGEIATGTPIPAIVPLPTLGMAPTPAKVRLIDDGRRAEVIHETTPAGEKLPMKNPGYPFFIPGVAGHRAPHPPLDFAWEEEKPGIPKLDEAGRKIYLDGGLPRHLVLDGKVVQEFHTRWDFTKEFILYNKQGKAVDGGLIAFELPEEGTEVEKVAMAAHATRTHATFLPNGDPGNFILNGLPPIHGAPYAAPSVSDDGNSVINTRRYKGANVQIDVVLNKKGWHYPQQRLITLWEDVKPTVAGVRPPQPFFFRSNTGETVEYWHTNLVPDYYDLDDFQVRTPTDILGQHIHLVKFDVTSSDGAANGFNYEDGTFSPDEVRKRIDAIMLRGGLYDFDPLTQFKGTKQRPLTVKPAPAVFGPPPPFQNWAGAQTTIQRWDTDPLLNNNGGDRTLRTVFTHDHFSPSTHQQIGLYAGLLVQPEGSKWFDPITGEQLYDTSKRGDGGPTSWQANIITQNPADSYREFALEFQDFQLAYTRESRTTPGTPSQFPTPSAAFNADASFASGLDGGQIPAGLRTAFAQGGITLSDKAAVRVVSKGKSWVITDTKAPDQAETYPIRMNSNQQVGLQIFTPDIVPGWSDPAYAINPPGDPNNTVNGPPYPALVSTGGPNTGTYSMNYRNEPLPLRLAGPSGGASETLSPLEAKRAVDTAFAFASIKRFDPEMNTQPGGQPTVYPHGQPINPRNNPDCYKDNPPCFRFPIEPLVPRGATGMQPTDPYTPLLRAYQNDKVQIRTLVGAHLFPHPFQIHGIRWLFEPSYVNSGFRALQGMSLSEHFEMLFKLPPAATSAERPFADYLYSASSDVGGLTNGLWGILRSYNGMGGARLMPDLVPLPNNPEGSAPPTNNFYCEEPARRFNVVATTAGQALPGGTLVFNSRGSATGSTPPFDQAHKIENPNALIYVRAEDLDGNGKLKSGVPIEPLVLRAAAGDCIEITLTNLFNPQAPVFSPQNATSAGSPFGVQSQANPPTTPVPAVKLNTTTTIGLNPQLVTYDITSGNGVNVGFNPVQTVALGESRTVRWYAGNIEVKPNGEVERIPVEFGAINLFPADPLVQHTFGLVGGLIIEPRGSTWVEDVNTRASATVKKADGSVFREFVVSMQVDSVQQGTGAAGGSVNYRSEPTGYRYPPGYSGDNSEAFSNNLVQSDPQTPVFVAAAGTPTRFRMLYPGGPENAGIVATIHGHVWQEEPFVKGSTEIGRNPLSQAFGSQQVVPNEPMNFVLESAGGKFKVPGDYRYYYYQDDGQGIWGIFRVSQPGKDAVVINRAVTNADNRLTVRGNNTVNPDTGRFAETVTLSVITPSGAMNLGTAQVNSFDGAWTFRQTGSAVKVGQVVRAQSSDGGVYEFTVTQSSGTYDDQ